MFFKCECFLLDSETNYKVKLVLVDGLYIFILPTKRAKMALKALKGTGFILFFIYFDPFSEHHIWSDWLERTSKHSVNSEDIVENVIFQDTKGYWNSKSMSKRAMRNVKKVQIEGIMGITTWETIHYPLWSNNHCVIKLTLWD